MATIKLTHDYHDESVKTFQCSDCNAEFVSVGDPYYCPECGEPVDEVKQERTKT